MGSKENRSEQALGSPPQKSKNKKTPARQNLCSTGFLPKSGPDMSSGGKDIDRGWPASSGLVLTS